MTEWVYLGSNELRSDNSTVALPPPAKKLISDSEGAGVFWSKPDTGEFAISNSPPPEKSLQEAISDHSEITSEDGASTVRIPHDFLPDSGITAGVRIYFASLDSREKDIEQVFLMTDAQVSNVSMGAWKLGESNINRLLADDIISIGELRSLLLSKRESNAGYSLVFFSKQLIWSRRQVILPQSVSELGFADDDSVYLRVTSDEESIEFLEIRQQIETDLSQWVGSEISWPESTRTFDMNNPNYSDRLGKPPSKHPHRNKLIDPDHIYEFEDTEESAPAVEVPYRVSYFLTDVVEEHVAIEGRRSPDGVYSIRVYKFEEYKQLFEGDFI